MKKIFTFILLSAFAISILSSCGGSETTLMDFIGADSGIIDLDGKEFIFIGDNEGDENSIIDGQIQANTTLYDAILKRFDEINKRYNIKIVYQTFGNSDAYEQRVTALMGTGICPGDIMYGHGNSKLQPFAEAGYLYPLTELKDYLNYENSAKFGTAGILESAMVNGVPYAVQPVNWPGFQNNFSYVIVYNPDIVLQQGYTDLHEYYENESWTWDVYQSMIENFDKGGNESVYALSGMERDFADLALRSNGVKYVDYIDGKLQLDITSSKAITAIQWMQNIFLNNSDKIEILDTWTLGSFAEGRVMTALAVTPQLTVSELQYESNIEFSIMPFPCGPDGTYGEWAQSAAAIRGLAIPSNNESPEIAARVINDLCDPLEEFGGDSGLADYFNQYVFFRPLDTQIFLTIGEHIRYSYPRTEPGLITLLYKIESAYKSSSAIEILETIAPQLNFFIENTVKPNFENYIYDHLYEE